MANDSSLLPEVQEPPGQATLFTAEKTVVIPGATGPDLESSGGGTVTTTDIEFDYSAHLDRIVVALERLTISMAFIADKIDNISDKIDNISTQSTVMSQTSTNMLNEVSELRNRADGDGLHIVGPWEWLGMSSIVKLYEEKGVNLTELKAKVDAVPKSI